MKILRWLGIGVLAILGLLVVVGTVSRFQDGGIGPFPGGPLEAGELIADPSVDWSFAVSVQEIEFQLLNPPRSRVTWILVHEGQLYIPCGYPNFRLLKQWPHEALRDGRSLLRIQGKRYERQAVRVEDSQQLVVLTEKLRQKYPLGAGYDPDKLWFFRMDPRS